MRRRRIVLLLMVVAALMTLLMVASVGTPASAQVNISPTIGTGDLLSGNQVNDNVSGNDVTVQCVADPLLGPGSTSPLPIGGSGDQCADDGGSNEGGGLELPGLP
jgi:hypothetical protein